MTTPGLLSLALALFDDANHGELTVVARLPRKLHVAAVAAHLPCRMVWFELQVEHSAQFLAQNQVFHRRHRFDPTFEVARHAIGRADEVLLGAGIAEIVNTSVFEEAPDNADDAYALGEPGNSRTQSAGVADDQVDFDPGLRRSVERARHVDVLERVHLHLDQTRRAGALETDLALDVLEQRPLEQGGRGQDLFESTSRAIAGGEKVEK